MATMKRSIAISALFVAWLGGATSVPLQDAQAGSVVDQVDPLNSDPNDPGNLLGEIERRNAKLKALSRPRGRSATKCKKKRDGKCWGG